MTGNKERIVEKYTFTIPKSKYLKEKHQKGRRIIIWD